MSQTAPTDRERALAERVRLLEEVNAALAEANEDFLLLGLVAEAIAEHDDVARVVEVGLERTAVLKDVPVCAYCELDGDAPVVRQSHVLVASDDLAADAVWLSDELIDRLEQATRPSAGTVCSVGDELRVALPDGAARDRALSSALLVPLSTRATAFGVFVFAGWDSAERMRAIAPVLVRIADMLIARMDNAALLAELERARAALDRKVERLTESARDLVWRTDGDRTMTFVNAAAERVLGVPVADAIGRDLSDFMSSESVARADEAAARARAAGRDHYTVAVDYRTPAGRVTTCEVNVTVVTDERGRQVAHEGIARDVTERVRAEVLERQAQKMEALGTLAGGVAHDFNNLLTPIMSGVHLALRALPDGAPAGQHLLQAQSAAQRAAELVRQILRFGRASTAERRTLLMRQIIADAGRFLRSALPASIEIETRWPRDDVPVQADPTELLQVVLNLCTNAGQAMPGGGTLTVMIERARLDAPLRTVDRELPPGSYACTTVRDTGGGIRPDALSRIFDPYFTTKPAGEGTGLGLSVALGVLRSLGGGITVDSRLGQGTTFRVYLPEVCARTAREASREAPRVDGSGRVLFVDDEQAIRAVVVASLELFGYEVVACEGGADALAQLEGEPAGFAVVVTDLTMPGMSGLDLLRAVRARHPRLPVVLCTGDPTRLDAEMLRDAGEPVVCPKPFLPADLAGAVRRALDRAPTGSAPAA